MQLQQFIVAQWQLVLIFVLSGGMLLWPLVHRRVSGVADAGTLQVTQLINNEKAVTVDLRETKELTDGKLPGAVHIPLSQLKERVGELERFKERPLILYCARGQRSRAAGSVLGRAGFTKLFNLAGGHKAWKDAGLPLDKN
ncbi:MAG: rhodanese-like domain-containing protein [Betaproteobacteria bacterium]|nr:rhodanese-like domain-containing protein [Betaproteobacteria bacterium]MBK9606889.1 rhodanese-like domain-containing protein [Betaproteobacteria bacterium]